MKPLKSFRIFADNDRHFFKVKVFASKSEMRQWWVRYCKECGRENIGNLDFGAMVIPYHLINSETGERGMEIGTVIFSSDQLGMGTVSHEMGHCAIWHDRLVNENVTATYGTEIGEDEERMLYLLAYYVMDIVRKLTKFGFYA